MSKNIRIENINEEAIKKLSPKVSLQKKAINVLLTGTLLGGIAFGSYQYMNTNYVPKLEGTQVLEIVINMDEVFEKELGTKVINGVTYDLDKMKDDLGLLYFYAEPLTNEEIDKQFLGIVEYIKKIEDANANITSGDDVVIVQGYLFKTIDLIPSDIYIETDKLIRSTVDKFFDNPKYKKALEFYFDGNYPGLASEYLSGRVPYEKLTTKDKEQYLRDWKFQLNYYRTLLEKAGFNNDPDVEYSSVEINFENKIVYVKQI